MDVSNMKNIVVLKNLPSNVVDEAIVILKSNKQAKKLEYIDKSTKVEYNTKKNTKDYLVKEAESVIVNYISKVENNGNDRFSGNLRNSTNKKYNNIERKYKKLKIYSFFASLAIIACVINAFIV